MQSVKDKEDSLSESILIRRFNSKDEEQMWLDSRTKDESYEVMSVVKEEEDSKFTDEGRQEKDSVSESFVKKEQSELFKRGEDFQYKTIIVKTYKSNMAKENPLENIDSIFKETDLNTEKQTFHRNIFNDILENMEKKKLEDLQTKYVEFLREAAELETFKCLKCEYETIHKGNLKSHLHLIHKKEMEEAWFQCTKCRYRVKNLNLLKTHQATHVESSDDEKYSDLDVPDVKDSSKNWRCDLCTFDTDDKKAIKGHKLSHKDPDNSKKFACYRCDYKVRFKKTLRRHLFKSHQIELKGCPLPDFKCPHCDYKTDLRSCYNIHLMQHESVNEVKWLLCKYCDFKTKHRASIKLHTLNHENAEKKFMCEVCSKRFRTKAHLQHHSNVHKDITEVGDVEKCPQCSFQSKYKSCLKQHMELHREPEFVCDICDHKSRRKYNHILHVQRHKDEKECQIYRCDICPYYTKFKVNLKAHISNGKHTPGEWKPRPFFVLNKSGPPVKSAVCNACGHEFSSKAALKKHSIVHKDKDEIKLYKCDRCNFESRHKSSYDVHQKTHEAPELMACEICGAKLRKKNYKMHLLTHQTVNESELFTCDLCSYQTKFRTYLRDHLRKKHNIITVSRPGRKKSNTMKDREQQNTSAT